MLTSPQPAAPAPPRRRGEAPPPGPRRRMRGDERRQQLIEAALHLFATNGFRGTTTRAIAQAAGVSEAIIFRHFPTKEDLYAAILNHKARQQGIDRSLDALRRAIAAGDDETLVLQIALKTLDTYRGDVDFQRLMLRAALEGHDLARVSQRTLGLPLFGLLRDYVAGRQQAGAFRAGDPALLVFALVSLPQYFVIVTRLFGLDVVARSDRETAATFARLILDGVRVRNASAAESVQGAHGAQRQTAGARARRAPTAAPRSKRTRTQRRKS